LPFGIPSRRSGRAANRHWTIIEALPDYRPKRKERLLPLQGLCYLGRDLRQPFSQDLDTGHDHIALHIRRVAKKLAKLMLKKGSGKSFAKRRCGSLQGNPCVQFGQSAGHRLVLFFRERVWRLAQGLGLDEAQLAKLKARLFGADVNRGLD